MVYLVMLLIKEQGHSCGEALQHVLTQVGQIQQYHLNGLKRNIVHMGHFEAEKPSILYQVMVILKVQSVLMT